MYQSLVVEGSDFHHTDTLATKDTFNQHKTTSLKLKQMLSKIIFCLELFQATIAVFLPSLAEKGGAGRPWAGKKG